MKGFFDLAAAAALFCLGISPAWAINQVVPQNFSTTIGATPVRVIPSLADGVARELVILQDDTANTSVSCSWTSSSPSLWGAGTFTFAGQAAPLIMQGGEDSVPTGELWCMGSAAGTVLTAQAFPR